MNKFIQLSIVTLSAALLASCVSPESNSTGWSINNKNNGGFQANLSYQGQETGPGLVFVEGGTFMMGQVEEDFIKDWNNVPRRVTVSSFYMDENEVTNLDYREYLYWLRRVYDYDYYPEIYRSALPDTLVWRDKLAFNDNFVENYLRHPAYNYYPVVGVNWLQAQRYCSWRTDRVNEAILIKEGILRELPEQMDADHFNTEVYLYKQEYVAQNKKGLKDLNPNSAFGKEGRPARIEDGIVLPKYRLPTEAEWEYACRAGTQTAYYFGNDPALLSKHAWYAKNSEDKFHKVGLKLPNPWGLYDMLGNLMEWTLNHYTPNAYANYTSVDSVPVANPKKYPKSVRGGGFSETAIELRSANRLHSDPVWNKRDPQIPKSKWWLTEAKNIGIRLVRPLVQPSEQEINEFFKTYLFIE